MGEGVNEERKYISQILYRGADPTLVDEPKEGERGLMRKSSTSIERGGHEPP